jgi:predicted ArsR family transcriptional regulator
MDPDATLDADAFRRLYPWLTDWFQRPNAALFTDAEQKEIATELGRRWGVEHPIAVLNELWTRFGAKVASVVRGIVHENARRDWVEIAARQPGRGIEDLIRLLWEPLGKAGFEFTSEKRSDGVQFRCTRCPHVAVARQLGAEDWMTLLLCGADFGMVAGFNPTMGFRRTQTLMEGHDCCDHFYSMMPDGRGDVRA